MALNLRAFQTTQQSSQGSNLNLRAFGVTPKPVPEEEQQEKIKKANEEALTAEENARWLNSPAGLFMETVKGLPKAAIEMGPDLVREMFTRPGGRLALSIQRIFDKEDRPKEFIPGQEASSVADFEKFFLGDEPINDFQEEGKKLAELVGVDTEKAEKMSIPLGVGLAVVDLFPPGKSAKSTLAVAKEIAKTGDVELIAKALKTIVNGNDEEIKMFAQGFVDLNDPKEIETIITKVAQEQEAMKNATQQLADTGLPTQDRGGTQLKEIFNFTNPSQPPMGKSKFFGQSLEDVAEYNEPGRTLTTGFVDENELYLGGSSIGYLQETGLANKANPIIGNLTGGRLKTFAELQDAVSDGADFIGNPNIEFSAAQQIAAEDLAKKGFKGAKWTSEDDLTPVQYQIWDDSILQKSAGSTKVDAAEGRLYDVKDVDLFHATDPKTKQLIEKQGFKAKIGPRSKEFGSKTKAVFLADNPEGAKRFDFFSTKRGEGVLPVKGQNLKVIDADSIEDAFAKAKTVKGIDAIRFPEQGQNTYMVLNPEKISVAQPPLFKKTTEPRLTPPEKKLALEKVGGEELEARQVAAELAAEERSLFNSSRIKDINRLKKIASSKVAQEGDIETLRRLNPKLTERVIEAVREMKKVEELSDSEVLDIALSLPTKADTVVKLPAELLQARSLTKQVKTFMQGVRDGSIKTKQQVKETQGALTAIIKDSNLDLKDKGKFLSSIKNVQTPRQLNKVFPKIIERIESLENASTIRSLRNQVVSELKGIRSRKTSGIPRGKFTADTQKALNEIKAASRMSRSGALAQASELAEKHADSMTPEIARQIDSLRIGGGTSKIEGMKQEELAEALEQIKSLKSTGRTINEAKVVERQKKITEIVDGGLEALGGKIDDAVAGVGIVEPKKGVFGFISTVDNWLQGVDTLLDKLSIFDKTNTGKLDGFLNKKLGEMVHLSRQEQNKGLRVWTEEIQDNFTRVWEAKGRKAAEVVNNNKKESVEFIVHGQTRKLSPNQIYKKWMEMQDSSLDETFEAMGWGDDQFKFINDFMDNNPKLKEWAQWQLDEFYPKYGESVKPIYEARFSMPFPSREKYSPIRRSSTEVYLDAEKSLLDNAYHMASDIPGGLKSRVKNTHGLEFVDGDQVLTSHIIQMEHFKAFDETVRTWRNVFGNPSVRTTIKARHGEDILSNVNHLIDNIARDGMDAASTVNFLDTLRGNFTRAVLGVNPTITLKQLSSIPAYITEMPSGAVGGIVDFFKYEADFWKHPIKNAKTLSSSEMVKARFSNMERDIKQLMKQRGAERMLAGKDSFLNKTMLNVKLGDQGALFQGGWAVYKSNYDRMIKRGIPHAKAHEEALKKFERATIRTQQAGEIENLSRLQTTGGSFGKLFTMFLTAPNAYYRIASRSLRNLRYGVGDPATNIRNLVITWVVLPMTFQFVSDGFRVDPKRQARAAIMGPLNGIPIVGENIEDVVRAFTGDDVFPTAGPPPFTISGKLASTLQRTIKKINNDEFTEEEVWKTMNDMVVVGGQATGVPIDPTIKLIQGSGSFITGKKDDPRSIIFSDYALGESGKTTEKSKSGSSLKDKYIKQKESSTKEKKSLKDKYIK